MSVETHPTAIQPDTAAPPTSMTGPMARIIAGSLAAGVAAALLLTLVVFAGGTESTITGSVLVAFGFGWALIATLTSRYTDRAPALGIRPGDSDGRHRPGAAGLHP